MRIRLLGMAAVAWLMAVATGLHAQSTTNSDSSGSNLTGPSITGTTVTGPKITSPGIKNPVIKGPTIKRDEDGSVSITAPTVAAPEIGGPKVDAPQMTAPEVTAPVIALPEFALPTVSLPQITLPQISVMEGNGVALIRMSGDILFDFDQDIIRPDAAATLTQVGTVLQARYADRPFTIHGHTDAKGSDNYNMDLSARRAAAVEAWFVARGIAPERISIMAQGETMPVAPNTLAGGQDNPAGRQQNRRVEIAISLK